MRFIRPRARHIPGKMNKLEERYSKNLESLKMAGEIIEYHYEKIKLKLADNTFFTMDFLVITKDEVQLHEVKGFWEDDARVKIKVAAEQFWFWKFIAIKEVKKSWVFEEF